jgi:hypothetical protein
MMRLRWTATSCCLLAACFTPDDDPPQGDSDTTGTDTTSASTPTDPDSTSLDTSGGPDPDATGPDPDTTATETDTDEPPVACTETGECEPGLFCIDEACRPCTDAPDGDALCAAEMPNAPFCDPDTMQCAACTAATCSGTTPICDGAVGCMPCTEHAQCPDSACHLMGEQQGGCFEIADVVEISDLEELDNELGQMGSGDQRVFRLSAETYDFISTPSANGEVAILGQPGTVFTGGATNLMNVAPGAYLYVSGIAISDGPFRALNCVSGAGLWIDDTRISGYPLGVFATCETHVRRSWISGPNVDAVGIEATAALFLESTAIGPNPGTGLVLGDVAVDLRYVTIADNGLSIDCDTNTSGEVRNSIIAGSAGGSIDASCFMTFVDNAVDTQGFGGQIGAHDPAWFADADAGDFHLSETGQDAIGPVADWDEGDPATDIDGDPRPMDRPSFPGIDEP